MGTLSNGNMNAQEVLQLEFEKLGKDLVSKYIELGMKASGQWERELEVLITSKSLNSLSAKIIGMQYTEQLHYGRRPNHDQSAKAIKAFVGWAGSTFIKKWLEDKGIIANPFAVAYGIAIRGTKYYREGGTDLLESVVTNERMQEIIDKIGIIEVDYMIKGLVKNYKELA